MNAQSDKMEMKTYNFIALKINLIIFMEWKK